MNEYLYQEITMYLLLMFILYNEVKNILASFLIALLLNLYDDEYLLYQLYQATLTMYYRLELICGELNIFDVMLIIFDLMPGKLFGNFVALKKEHNFLFVYQNIFY
jgi:hypothetical protein